MRKRIIFFLIAALTLCACGKNGMTDEFAALKEAAESKSGIIYRTTYFEANRGAEGFPYPERNAEGRARFVYLDDDGKKTALTDYAFADARDSYVVAENLYLAPATEDGEKWGYVLLDKAAPGDFDWDIEPVYENAEMFSEQLAAVKTDGKYGAINENGDLVLPAVYDSMKFRSFGMLPVELEGEWYFLDGGGDRLYGPFEDAESYDYGFAAVKRGGKWGFIDKSGMDATAFVYDEAYSVEGDGSAWVRTGEKWRQVQVRTAEE